MNNYKYAALFDFDGVVMDTEGQYSQIWHEIGCTYRPDIDHFELVIKGQTLKNIFAAYFANNIEQQTQIENRLNEFEKNMRYEFIPGVVKFITELKAHNVGTALVTSSNNIKMQNVYLAHPEIKQLFDHILTANNFTHSKPHPECFLLGAKLLNTAIENTFVFEDSFHGMLAGRNAGMHVIGVATTNSRQAIADRADIIIDGFENFDYKQMLAMK